MCIRDRGHGQGETGSGTALALNVQIAAHALQNIFHHIQSHAAAGVFRHRIAGGKARTEDHADQDVYKRQSEGTPVAGGACDIDAGALGVGLTDPGRLCMIAGTWSINEYIATAPITDGSVLMNSLFCLPGYYLVEECSPTSAGNNEWFIKNLLPELRRECAKTDLDLYYTMNHWVEEIPVHEFCPLYLPFLMGSNVHPNACGSFVGINHFHTRKHLLRSVYEGVAFSHRWHLEKLLQTRREPPVSIRLAGGAARSPVWTQMFADVMKLPVESIAAGETGALGCAVLGAAACGDYPDVKRCV